MSDDVIAMFGDHRKVRSPFTQFQNASDGAHTSRGRMVEQMLQELTVHRYLENEVMYPEVRRLVPGLEQDVLESFEDHHVADVLGTELAVLWPTDGRFTARTTVLIENLAHHMDEGVNDCSPRSGPRWDASSSARSVPGCSN
jgi:hypothetical protein